MESMADRYMRSHASDFEAMDRLESMAGRRAAERMAAELREDAWNGVREFASGFALGLVATGYPLILGAVILGAL